MLLGTNEGCLNYDIKTKRSSPYLQHIPFFQTNITDVVLYSIPPTIIQPFVENAILHGLSKKEEGGKLLVLLKMKNKYTVECTVEDNGVGRNITTKRKLHKSMGVHLIRERLKLLLVTKKEVITYIDKTNPSDTGTVVKVLIPIQKAYESTHH